MKNKKRKIRRRCRGGCGGITSPGKKYILGHTWENKKRSEETKRKMRKPKSVEAKRNMSLASKGKTKSKESILKRSLANLKCNPNDEYCDIWRDGEYKKDIRKDYCENKNCKGHYKQLDNHHVFLDKKRCAPNEVMTLCCSCHVVLHNALQDGKRKSADPKDFIIINRLDHVSYINKLTRKIIRINKKER